MQSVKIKVFGITGTNGKTTVSWMLRNILKTAGKRCALIGTVEYEIGGEKYEPINTTPGEALLKELFFKMSEEEIRYCIMEVSSHGLDQNRIKNVEFSCCGFTNLTEDHLDYHKSMEDYYRAKKKLFYRCSETAVVNIDDKYGRRLYEELSAEFTGSEKRQPRLISCSLKDEQADIFGQMIKGGLKISTVELRGAGILEVPLGGEHFVYDAVLAAAMALESGIEFGNVKEGIETMPQVPGRSEIVSSVKDIDVIIDYAHTPDALENLLKTGAAFKKGSLICVFGCGGDRDKEKRVLMGEIAGKYADYCIITSDNPRSEPPEDICAAVEEGVYSANGRYTVIIDRYEAIRRAVFLATKWDIIVIAGKGHEKYQTVGDKKIYFSDKEAAKELLEKK